MTDLLMMVKGQQWLASLDDADASGVVCQALQLKPHLVPAVAEYAYALHAATSGLHDAAAAGQLAEPTATDISALLLQAEAASAAGAAVTAGGGWENATRVGGPGGWENATGVGGVGAGAQIGAEQWPELAGLAGGMAGLPGTLADGRLTGIIKSFNELKGYGFIYCQRVTESRGCDVFLQKQHKGNLPVGSEVSFELKIGQKGDPQAIEVRPLAGGGAPTAMSPTQIGQALQLAAMQSLAAGQGLGLHQGSGRGGPDPSELTAIGDHIGVLKSFNAEKGFGFICCDELKEKGLKDAFLHQSELKGHRVGDVVAFGAFLNSKGEPRAKDLRAAGPSQPALTDLTPTGARILPAFQSASGKKPRLF